MKQFLLAHSASKPTDDMLNDCINQLGHIPPEATFGFLYISDFLFEEADYILNQLKDLTDIAHWAGSIGSGLISTNLEYYEQPAIVIMLADFNEAHFQLLPNITDRSFKLDKQLLNWCTNNDFNVGILHAAPENPEIQQIIHQLGQDIPASFLVGGVSSSQHGHSHVNNQGQSVQYANDTFNSGVSGVIFSDKIPILSNLTQGCSPIGPRHLVTASSKNVIYTLDNKPALDVLTNDAGEIIARDWQQASSYIFTGLINKNSDTDDYTVRQLLGVDIDNKLIAIADFLQDDQEIIFCKRDANSALEDMQRMLLQLKARHGSHIKGGLYISCLGRGREQFGSHSEEVRLIHSVLGEFPLAGFFANGEIHKSLLYGFTGVLTLFI